MHGTGHGIGAFLSIHEGMDIGQKINIFIKGFCSKCNHIRIQIRNKLRMWSYLLKKSLMENFSFCVMETFTYFIGKTWKITVRKLSI